MYVYCPEEAIVFTDLSVTVLYMNGINRVVFLSQSEELEEDGLSMEVDDEELEETDFVEDEDDEDEETERVDEEDEELLVERELRDEKVEDEELLNSTELEELNDLDELEELEDIVNLSIQQIQGEVVLIFLENCLSNSLFQCRFPYRSNLDELVHERSNLPLLLLLTRILDF